MIKPFIALVAGHIDHGKTRLLKALTGDERLDGRPEEKRRGITMDLGFTSLDLGDPNERPLMYRLGIIDVPGHADFVKNMVAGTGVAEIALLVVAADDGWMPQTEEHLHVLNYAGVKRLVVAVNKSDIGNEATARTVEQVKAQLAATPFRDSEVVAVSALTASGLTELKDGLLNSIRSLEPPFNDDRPRLMVDRVFTVEGRGTVVTGSLVGGTIRVGQTLAWMPDDGQVRIRALQSHHESCDEVYPGMRVAANIVVTGDTQLDLQQMKRGAVLCAPGALVSSAVIDVWLHRVERKDWIPKNSIRPLRHDMRVRVHVGCSNISAQLLLLSTDSLEIGEQSLARLKLDEPISTVYGERLVLRDDSEQSTLAGGVVLDAQPPQNLSPRKGKQAEYLKSCSARWENRDAAMVACVNRGGVVLISTLQKRFDMGPIGWDHWKVRNASQAALDVIGHHVVDSAYWQSSLLAVEHEVDAFYQQHPEASGMKLEAVKATLAKFYDDEDLVQRALIKLQAKGAEIVGDVFRRKKRAVELPDELKQRLKNIRIQMAQDWETPYSPDKNDLDENRILEYLLNREEVVSMAGGSFLLKHSYQGKVERVKAFLEQEGASTVSALKEAAQLSRKHLVPFLEHLDKERITLREGERRRLFGKR